MRTSHTSHARKYFNTKEKWTEISSTEVKRSEMRQDTDPCKMIEHKEKKKEDHIYRQCIEYWDDIKEKYKYNHLYRKRVLKIKQEDLQTYAEVKSKLNELFNKDGEVMAQYANKSNDINVRGEGVWKSLNGEESIPSIDEKDKSKESINSDTPHTESNLLDDLRNCIINESQRAQSDVFTPGTPPNSIEKQSFDENQCLHIVKKDHRKLFNIPECIDEESEDTDSSVFAPTVFEWCMKELHDFKSPEGSDKTSKKSDSIIDPWCKLEKCQERKYGFTNREFCEKVEEEESTEEEVSDEDLYEKVINKVIENNLRISGTKTKIKNLLGIDATDEHTDQLKSAELTAKVKDHLLQGLDLRREPHHADEERENFKNIMETLTGEWTTMKMFLKELAENSIMLTAKRAMSVHKKSLPKRTLGPLGKSVHKMVAEMLEKDDTKMESKDVNVAIKYEIFQSKCYPKPFKASPCFGQERVERNINLNYREKQEYAIKLDRKGEKIISKQSATKKEFNIAPKETKLFNSSVVDSGMSTDSSGRNPGGEETGNVNKGKQTFHRGLVELISGSMYAGSWNQLGMEGCGKYISPGGTIIDGYMSDGIFNGPATIYLPNGMIIAGAFDKGEFLSPKVTFGDGLEYKSGDWEYLKETKKLNKSEIRTYRPILNREIPEGCYDVGEGFYDLKSRLIYHPVTLTPIRSVSAREEKWIVSICRAAKSKCVSLDEHLYETVDIPLARKNLRNPFITSDPWSDCRSPLYQIPPKDDSKEPRVSLDSLIQIDEKSKPVEELWDNVVQLTGAHKAKVSVPFSYEKAFNYTCNDHLLKYDSTKHDVHASIKRS